MQNIQLDEVHAEIKVSGRNINNVRYADDTTLMGESEELKSLWMKMKEEGEKILKAQNSGTSDHGIQSHHVMANRWGNNTNRGRLLRGGLQNHC